MDEIIAEAGMSFLLECLATMAAMEHPPSSERALIECMGGLSLHVAEPDPTDDQRQALGSSAHLVVNAWVELPRDPQVGDMIRDNYLARSVGPTDQSDAP